MGFRNFLKKSTGQYDKYKLPKSQLNKAHVHKILKNGTYFDITLPIIEKSGRKQQSDIQEEIKQL